MQTFLPFPSFEESARVLDNKRLGKQRVETMQILKALTLPTYGWKNLEKIAAFETTDTGQPAWVGDETVHASHRSNLLRKDPLFYGRYGWAEPPDLPYAWP
jgi:Pyrimidine dimer DNA glycosylase